VIADVERWHEWTASVRSIRLLDRESLHVGSRAVVRQPKLPPSLWKVTAIDPGRSFTWKAGAPGMWVYANHFVTPLDRGARATLGVHFSGPIGVLIGRVLRTLNNQYLGMEAAGLKRRCEERASAGR
jgi:hypothetical protein